MKLDMFVTYVIRAVLAILCGGVILIMASPSTVSLGIIFSVYCVLDGIATFILSLGGDDKKEPRWYLIGESAVNVASGILIFIFGAVFTFLMPRITALVVLFLVSGRIILIGLLELLVGVFGKKAAPLFRVPIGLSSIIFGLILIFQDKNIHAFAVPIGIYAIVVGIFLILACLKLKSAKESEVAPKP